VAPDPLARPEEAIRRLYSYVAYRIGSGADAEDVVSETLERALRYRASYDERRGSPVGWLVAIASNVLADRGHADATVALDAVPEPASDEDVMSRSLERLDLRRAMSLLDARSRDLLALRYGADLKAREIAELRGLRTNAVEVALHRALARLRVLLEEAGQAPAAGDGTVALRVDP
jgi:RNA polymerase sigma-70 factor (ECF subfamily)